MKTKEQLVKEFELVKGDVARWQWVIENKDEKNLPPVILDNDDTAIYIQLDGDEDPHCLQFLGYLGWGDGVISLLEAIGIKAEGA